MTHDRDPFDILRENNPFDPRDIDAYSPEADELLRRIMSQPRTAGTSRRRRLILIAAAVALLLLLTAAAQWFGRTQDLSEIAVACFEEATTESSRVGTVAVGAPDVSICEEPWKDGVLTNPAVEPGEVPPLTGCVADMGAFWVFPTDDRHVCEQLGLAVPNPNQSTGEFDDLGAAREEIFVYLDSASCQPLDEAEALFRSILDSHGLTDWTIRRRPDHPERPCVSIAYDVPTETLILVPMPDMGDDMGEREDGSIDH